MTDLEWTDEPPEEEGWYWLDDDDFPTFSPRCVEVADHHSPLSYETGVWDPNKREGSIVTVSDYKNVRWAGPIPRPSDPHQDQ